MLHFRKFESIFCEVEFSDEGPQQVDKVIVSLYSESSDADDCLSSSSDQDLIQKQSLKRDMLKRCSLQAKIFLDKTNNTTEQQKKAF